MEFLIQKGIAVVITWFQIVFAVDKEAWHLWSDGIASLQYKKYTGISLTDVTILKC